MHQTKIYPAAESRQLFNKMVNLAGPHGIVDLPSTLMLAVATNYRNKDEDWAEQINDLIDEGWLEPDPCSGGWIIL